MTAPPRRPGTARDTLTARAILAVAGLLLLGTARWMLGLDGAALPPPDPGRWAAWWSQRPVIDSVVALARPVALTGMAVLVVLVVMALLSVRHPRRVPARWLARLGALGAALLSLATAAAAPVGASSDGGTTGAGRPPDAVVVTSSTPAVPHHDLAPSEDGPSMPRTELPWAEGPVIGEPLRQPGAVGPATIVVVRPGDHLWSIAETEVGRTLGRAPTTSEIDPYWRTLVDANRDRLVDDDDPDLIYPGQELVLPPW